MERLQSNVSLVLEEATSSTTASSNRVALERRIKAQARVRADKDVQRQEKILDDAERIYLSGDYETAEKMYSEALEIGASLEKLEQEESVETKKRNERISKQLKPSHP